MAGHVAACKGHMGGHHHRQPPSIDFTDTLAEPGHECLLTVFSLCIFNMRVILWKYMRHGNYIAAFVSRIVVHGDNVPVKVHAPVCLAFYPSYYSHPEMRPQRARNLKA